MAGKQRGNIFSALMENFDIARDVLESSSNASGSAAAEHEKYMESMSAKLNQMAAAWQDLSQTTLDSDFLKGFIDLGTDFLSVLKDIIDNIGVLPSLIGAVTAAMSVKNVGRDKMSSLGFELPTVIDFH